MNPKHISYIIIILVITASVFSYIIFDVSAGQIINKMLKRDSLDRGLVGHWTFDGKDMLTNVADVSGNGNTGYLQGQTSTTTAIGKIGQALSFDGVNDYVDLGSDESLNLNSNMSIGAWIKTNDTGRSWLLMKYISTPFYGLSINEVTANDVSFNIRDEFGNYIKTGSITTVNDNLWHYVVGVRNIANDTLDMYIDGVLDKQVSDTTTGSITNSSIVTIGKNSNYDTEYFNGTIDDVRIYNRALSADEITRLYHLGATAKINKTLKSATSPLEDGLVGHWTFDGKDMLTNVADVSGQGNHGSLVGQTSTTTAIGKIGQALEFDGVDDWVDVTDNNNLSFGDGSTDSPFSIKTTFKSRDASVSQGIVAKSSTHNVGEYYLFIYSNNLYFRTVDDSTGAYVGVVYPSISNNTWYDVVGTYDGSGSSSGISLFIDGAAVSTTDSSYGVYTAMENTGNALHIGKRGTLFDGTIDDVRIYNRALSADEITRLYNLGR